jgi:hypothetical protein
MKTLWFAVLVLAWLGAGAARADPWEGQGLSEPDRRACRPVPPDLVRPVTPARRQAAARLLDSAQAVVLDDAQAGAWIGVDAPKGGALADRLLTDAIHALEERRIESWGEHAEKWSLAEQRSLDTLRQVWAEPHAPFQPVLVRAVAGVEATGAFDAAECGGVLAIRHLSRGASTPDVMHVPVIVFLEQPPASVHASREVLKP